MPGLLHTLIDVYSFVVLLSVIFSWLALSPYHPLRQIPGALVDPILDPIRRMVPPAGGLDFSPMVLLILLQLMKNAL